MRLAVLALALAASSSIACSERPRSSSADAPAGAATTTLAALFAGPVRTEEVAVPNDRGAFVVKGARAHRRTMLFLGGMCSHPAGYAMSFQHTAASRGDLVGVQGDVSCGGDGNLRSWSSDLEKMDRRIDAAFEAAGLGKPSDLLVIGYSQGAERAEKLVARWPEKYSRAILIASPTTPSPALLRKAKGVVLMAGTFDISRARMKGAVGPLRKVGLTAEFFELPNAHHGAMGDTPEASMAAALDVLDDPERRETK